MKLKRYALAVLILGVAFFLAGVFMPFIYLSFGPHNGTAGIIGGAGMPTYQFIFSELFDGLLPALTLFGLCFIISAGFCLLFTKTVKTHCSLATSAISLGLSASGALGLVCLMLWITIVSFHEMARYPVAYPVSILLGCLCFFVFLALLALYFRARKADRSIKGILIDILTAMIYLPAFFCAFLYLYETVS